MLRFLFVHLNDKFSVILPFLYLFVHVEKNQY